MNIPNLRTGRKRRGFMLFETLIAVILLVLAVLGLSRAFAELLAVQQIRVEQAGTRAVLDEVLAQLRSSPSVPPQELKMSYAEWWKSLGATGALPVNDRAAGIQVSIRTEPFEVETKDGDPVPGLHRVEVVVEDPLTGLADQVSFVLSRQ